MSDKTFIEKCIDGEALIYDIDEYVANWHNASPELKLSLREYLGMTETEYNSWVLDDEVLPFIIKAHKEKEDFSASYITSDVKMAARSADQKQVEKLLNWIKENE